MAQFKFLEGTLEKFATITKEAGTLYKVNDTVNSKVDYYFGEQKINNASDLAAAITRIAANESSIAGLVSLTNKIDGDATVDGSTRKLIADAVAAVTSSYEAADTAINTKIGTVPEGSNLVSMIAAAQSAATYDDTALAARVTANESAITVLNGDGTDGSVKKTVADAIAAVVASAPTSFDTLKEISDWISGHASDATAMNTSIAANASAIASLTSFVGESLPSGVSASTVIGYVTEAFDAAETRATGAEEALASRVSTLESQVGSDVPTQIASAINALDSSLAATSGYALTGITIEDGMLTGKTEMSFASVAFTGNASDVSYTPSGDGAVATTVKAALDAHTVAIATGVSEAKSYADDLFTWGSF